MSSEELTTDENESLPASSSTWNVFELSTSDITAPELHIWLLLLLYKAPLRVVVPVALLLIDTGKRPDPMESASAISPALIKTRSPFVSSSAKLFIETI